jgi:endonuclease YncB( thermonuclease family)
MMEVDDIFMMSGWVEESDTLEGISRFHAIARTATLFPFTFPALVCDWVDGDSPKLVIDRGWHDFKGSARKPVDCRVFAIDSPEKDNPEGWTKAREWALKTCPPGSNIIVISTKLEKYGRPLIIIGLQDGHDFASLAMNSGLYKAMKALPEEYRT